MPYVNKENMPIQWRIEGPFDSTYSLALLNRELARALRQLGVNVALHSTEGPGDFLPSEAFLSNNPDLREMYQQSLEKSQLDVDVSSRNLYPPRVEDMQSANNMLHSYAWEESAFPAEWVDNFNKHLTAMTCLSDHVYKVMQDNGVRIPMAVSGCGVDHWERVVADANYHPDFGEYNNAFKFLHVSSFFPRKGPEALLHAYGQAFSASDNVVLVIKTFPNPHNTIHELLAEYRAECSEYPEVMIIEDDLSDSSLKALYEQCDVLVSPSCAEGFGLPLAEAMLSGIPVITTNWSGQLDFCNASNAWLVDYHYAQANTHFDLLPSAWAEIDRPGLAAAMHEAMETSLSKRQHMASHGRELLLTKFKWVDVANRLVSFYKKLPEKYKDNRSPKIGWITTWNVKCGIATYSYHLASHLESEITVLAANSSELLEPDGKNCLRCWTAGDNDPLHELAVTINELGLDVVVIQFNFGFFHHDHLAEFVASQKMAGRVVVVDIHATQDPPQAPHKKMTNFVPALRDCDRLLVHTIADMNRMKSCGLNDNLVLFPHGILEHEVSENQGSKIPTIATYGFCLPHKGLQEIVSSVAILKEKGTPVRLLMVNAEYPVDFSAALVSELRDQIVGLGLQDYVLFESRFLEDGESLDLLSQADLMLFLYHPTSESASGAVRYGMATGKPVLVTDLPIFAEFGDAVWRMCDVTPESISKKLSEVLDDIFTESVDYKRRLELADTWREQHSYPRLARRLSGMLDGLFINKSNV